VKLKELEKRLKHEPDNLGLRVQVAGLMREAGRSTEAVELYRSVALAYRDQGRAQQAIAVCRSILEIAPDDVACTALMSTLSGEPNRRSSQLETPLPKPIPHHIHDPTSKAILAHSDERDTNPDPTLPRPRPKRPTRPMRGGDDDLAQSLDTRPVRRTAGDQLAKIAPPSTTEEIERLSEEIITEPRERTDPDE
jgi:hypothetical protein